MIVFLATLRLATASQQSSSSLTGAASQELSVGEGEWWYWEDVSITGISEETFFASATSQEHSVGEGVYWYWDDPKDITGQSSSGVSEKEECNQVSIFDDVEENIMGKSCSTDGPLPRPQPSSLSAASANRARATSEAAPTKSASVFAMKVKGLPWDINLKSNLHIVFPKSNQRKNSMGHDGAVIHYDNEDDLKRSLNDANDLICFRFEPQHDFYFWKKQSWRNARLFGHGGLWIKAAATKREGYALFPKTEVPDIFLHGKGNVPRGRLKATLLSED